MIPKKQQKTVPAKGRRGPGGGGTENWTQDYRKLSFLKVHKSVRDWIEAGRPVPSDSHNNDPWGLPGNRVVNDFLGGLAGSAPRYILNPVLPGVALKPYGRVPGGRCQYTWPRRSTLADSARSTFAFYHDHNVTKMLLWFADDPNMPCGMFESIETLLKVALLIGPLFIGPY